MSVARSTTAMMLAIQIGILNAFDLVATLFWLIISGPEIELNPIMRELWTNYPNIFISAKLFISIFVPCFFLTIAAGRGFHRRESGAAMIGLWVVAISYYLLAWWHGYVFWQSVIELETMTQPIQIRGIRHLLR